MADNMLHSPGIKITETDKSFVPARPLIAGAAIIGPTPIGPAYAPTVCTSYGDYQRRFGTTFMMNRYAEGWKDAADQAEASASAQVEESYKLYSREGEGTEESPYTYTEVATLEPGNYYKRSGEGTEESPYEYAEYELTDVEAYQKEYSSSLSESKSAAREEAVESKKLQRKKQEFLTSIAAKSFFEQGGNSLLVVRVTDNDFTSGKAVVKNAAGDDAFTIKTVSQGEYLNNWEGENQDRTETSESIENVIREDGSLVSGSRDNIRWEITDVDEETGTFSLYVRRGDDLDYDKNILEAFTGLSLDPDSSNFISRRIGDQHQVLVEKEETDDDTITYVNVVGNYPNVSRYIYVENVNEIYGYFLADGFTRQGQKTDENGDVIPPAENPEDVANQLPVTCEGGFSGATGKLFTIAEDEAKAAFFEDIAAHAESSLETTVKIQGVDVARYDAAIDLLRNTDEYEINMIAAPGLTGDNAQAQVDALVSLASERGDLIAVVDLVGFGAKIPEVKQIAQRVNSNYAATYWPWLQMYSSTGRLEWVPASTIIMGVYTFTDHISAPWFAPAGMTRGSVQGVVQPEKKLLKQHRDDLYKKNINPISILPGNGITIYGQKTLQKKATALDRVNVRRLMIELKKHVKDMAAGILFEHNTKEIRNQFKGALDSYLESVVQRRGLYTFKTIVDEVNTPDVIDRNEFRCQIYVQPTKVIEFIYIDFTITNTGVEFNN
jgi:hypothetical protein